MELDQKMADFSLYHFIDFGNNYAHKNQTTVQMKNTKKTRRANAHSHIQKIYYYSF